MTKLIPKNLLIDNLLTKNNDEKEDKEKIKQNKNKQLLALLILIWLFGIVFRILVPWKWLNESDSEKHAYGEAVTAKLDEIEENTPLQKTKQTKKKHIK